MSLLWKFCEQLYYLRGITFQPSRCACICHVVVLASEVKGYQA